MTALIIFAAVVCGVVISAWSLVAYVKHKIRRLGGELTGGLVGSMLGGGAAMEGFLEGALEDESTVPKSVSAMTSVYLPKIVKDFPDFNYDEMKRMAETFLMTYLRAIDSGNADEIRYGDSEFREKVRNYIDMNVQNRIKEYFQLVRIHRTEITNYRKAAGKCIITFQSSIEYRHFKESDGQLLAGRRDKMCQTRYDVDLIYIQDREKVESDFDSAQGFNCPNCGAPITSLGHKRCEYCGCGVEEYNIKVWVFSDARER